MNYILKQERDFYGIYLLSQVHHLPKGAEMVG